MYRYDYYDDILFLFNLLIMSGLYYGNRYKKFPPKKEGVHFMIKTGKWVVRIKKLVNEKSGLHVTSTIAQYDTQEEAQDCYNKKKYCNKI